MGMFDHVCSEMPLPVGNGRMHLFGRETQFQTKSFDEQFGGNLDRLIITAAGNLYAAYVDEENNVDYDEEADPTDFTGELLFYGDIIVGGADRHERGWAEWEAEFAQGRLLSIKMCHWDNWDIPKGFPPISREELYARALKLIVWGATPNSRDGGEMHYDELATVAEEVLVGKTEHLELHEEELKEKRG